MIITFIVVFVFNLKAIVLQIFVLSDIRNSHSIGSEDSNLVGCEAV